jgi:L-iditol 2-dehydrogenase
VLEVGGAVRDLAPGARVVLDQGLNCRSTRREPPCEYCASADSHQCEFYAEHGITGLPGGFAEELVLPGVNAVRLESALSFEAAVLSEPLACVLHALDFAERTRARYALRGSERVRTAVLLGAGPAGLFFVQVMRRVLGFEGALVVSDPSPAKRARAGAQGAEACAPEELEELVLERTAGRRAELVIEASGSAAAFAALPSLARKQATALLYGIGHGGASLELLNPVQWRELVLVTSVGASGGFDADGRPSVYRRALELLERGAIDVRGLVTHTYRGLAAVPCAFTGDAQAPDYVKGVAIL